jgi:hypothetical protein
MEFTRSDLENMKMIKEKLGTWSDTYDYLGIAPRTGYRIRKRFKDNPDLNIYNMKADNAEMVEKRIDFLVDKSEKEIQQVDPQRPLKRNQKTIDKYNLDRGIPSLNYDDYAYYDEKAESWKAGQFSNLETGKEISKSKARMIRGASLRQIRKINKAKQFMKQQDIDPVTAYEKANKWDQKYHQSKQIFKEQQFKDIAFKDSNGRWHWGPNGKGSRGSYAKESEVKKLKKKFKLEEDLKDQVRFYTDQVFSLIDSP